MNRYGFQVPHRNVVEDEDHIVGEILEDIECLELDESDPESTDKLNADTFGNDGDVYWDPTETFLEAEKIQNSRSARPPRLYTELVKFNMSSVDKIRSPKLRQIKNERKQKRNECHKRFTSRDTESYTHCRSEKWDDDIELLREYGLFEINDGYLNLFASEGTKIPPIWEVSQNILIRHLVGVERIPETIDKELFMNEHEFDQILRIHLAQICKDPKLQNYTGKWNIRHLGIKQNSDDKKEDAETESAKDEKSKKQVNKPNRFGKISSTSIRHGRRLIYLTGNTETAVAGSSTIDRNRMLRERIEFCYETLYVLSDIEEEIEKCPMNHVAALDKMQKERNEKLNELFVALMGDSNGLYDVLELNKGRILTVRAGRKLGIEMKLILLCLIVDYTQVFLEMCNAADVALKEEPTLVDFIKLTANAEHLKPIVAFEGSSLWDAEDSVGRSIQLKLFHHSSLTKLFLFVLEGIALAGHLFLLSSDEGRKTALQRCCNILVRAQQKCKGFEQILSTRSGVMFFNIFLERIRLNEGTVDRSTIDIILHYTLEISENIVSNRREWNNLASNIMKMF